MRLQHRSSYLLTYTGIFCICSGFIVYGNNCNGGFQYAAFPSSLNGVKYAIDVSSLALLDANDATTYFSTNTPTQIATARLNALANAGSEWNNANNSSFRYIYDGDIAVNNGNLGLQYVVDCAGSGPNGTPLLEPKIIVTDKADTAEPSGPPAPGVLAQTVTYFCLGGVIRGFWVELYSDPENTLTSDLALSQGIGVDIQTVIAHELGHGLGLQHYAVSPTGGPGIPPVGNGITSAVAINGGIGDPGCGNGQPYDLMCKYTPGSTVLLPQTDDLQGEAQLYPPTTQLLIDITANDPRQGLSNGTNLGPIHPVTTDGAPVTVNFTWSWLDGNNLEAGIQVIGMTAITFNYVSDYYVMHVDYDKHDIGNDDAGFGILVMRQGDTALTDGTGNVTGSTDSANVSVGLSEDNIAEVKFVAQ